MSRTRTGAAIALLVSFAAFPARASGGPAGSDPEDLIAKLRAARQRAGFSQQSGTAAPAAPGRLLAGLRPGARPERLRAAGAEVLEAVGGGTYVVRARDRARLLADPAVRFVERDLRRASLAQTTDWGVEAVGAPEAHTTNGATGAGVIVAIVDTGVDYTHEDLEAGIWANPGETGTDGGGNDKRTNGIDDDGNGYVDDHRGWDFAGAGFTGEEDNDPMDGFGHGTHVAGIVAAADNTDGVLGVAPDATIMPLKVLDDWGFGFDSDIAEGIRYAAEMGADVINMSLGGYGRSATLEAAVEEAVAAGVAVVAAAGNEAFYSIAPFPAAYPDVISVSAAAKSPFEDHGGFEKTWWSNWGNVDFLAPGEDVLSSVPGDGYERFSGTSMASPMVAGAIALVKEMHPTFSPAQLEQALAATSAQVYYEGKDEVSGSGVPDAEAATAVLPAVMTEWFRDQTHVIDSDGADEAPLTLRMLGADGAPLAGVTGAFSAPAGTLTVVAFTTPADGEATTTLPVEDLYGVARVTATPDGSASRAVSIVALDPQVRVDTAAVEPAGGSGDEEPFASEDGEEDGGEAISTMLEPGDDVHVVATLGLHRPGATARASFSYSVTGPSGDPVPELAGTTEEIDLWGWSTQTDVSSYLHTIPGDAEPGRYALTVTATTAATGETDTREISFFVGVPAEVLVIESPGLNAESLDSFGGELRVEWGWRQLLDDAGIVYDYLSGGPRGLDLTGYAAILWFGGWADDLDTGLEDYLASGGNVLLAGELWGTFDRAEGGSTFHRDVLGVTGLLTGWFPDPNHRAMPSTVTGTPGGLFEGETFDIDAYDLNGSRNATALFNDELLLLAGSDLTPTFTWSDGVYAPAIAGGERDDGVSRLLYTSFGPEGIDGGGSTMDVDAFLDRVLGYLVPDPAIDSVVAAPLKVSGGTARIVGDGFQTVGQTTVLIDGVEMDSFVLDRGTVVVDLPGDLARGAHDVTVEGPLGTLVTAPDALVIRWAAPVVRSVRPSFASNDRRRYVEIVGSGFRDGARALIGGRGVEILALDETGVLVTLPAGFGPLGRQAARVVNPGGAAGTRANAVNIRFGFRRDLRYRDVATDVGYLQRRLIGYGYLPRDFEVSRVFNAATRRALVAFQRARRLVADGILGPATRRVLNDRA